MRRALRICALVALTASVLAISGCNRDVAARVNGEAIKTSVIEEQLKQAKAQYPQMFTGADAEARTIDFRKRVLDTLISQELLRQAAEDSGIKVTDKEVEQQIADLKKGFTSQAAFDEALKKSGIDAEQLQDQVRDQIVQTRLIASLTKSIKISDQQIKDYYAKNKGSYVEKAAVHAAHILFAENDKATAQKVLDQVRDGGDFAALAKRYSKDTASAAKGGDLGWPTTPYVQEFQAAADKLDPGKTSGLVKSPFGWHIIRVIEKRAERQKTLAQVKEEIRQILVQQKQAQVYQDYLEGLRKKAKIEILDKQLKEAEATSESSDK